MNVLKAGSRRNLVFLCLTDDNRYDRPEGGLNQKGEKTQSRMALERMLAKTKDIDGKPVKVFCLAEKPTGVFNSDDPFDREFLRDDTGNWRQPSKEWLAARAKLIGKRNDASARAEAQVKQLASNKVVEGLAALVAGGAFEAPKKPDGQKAGEGKAGDKKPDGQKAGEGGAA